MKNDPRPLLTSRQKALQWWNRLSFEEQFFKTIEFNDLLHYGDRTRNPDTLTGFEIEKIWKAHYEQ